jgi:hypothetical protein
MVIFTAYHLSSWFRSRRPELNVLTSDEEDRGGFAAPTPATQKQACWGPRPPGTQQTPLLRLLGGKLDHSRISWINTGLARKTPP